MIVTTIDTNQTFEIDDQPLEYGKPYVFREESNEDWNLAESWNHMPTDNGIHVLMLINPTMIRKRIVREIK
jgi:hypothetical protein